MSQPEIKICGITTLEDALAAVDAGADYLGFMFAPSPRQVDRGTVERIVSRLPGGVRRVGVFVDASLNEIRSVCEECGLHLAQLHGAEGPDLARELGRARVWKVFRVRSEIDLEGIRAYDDAAGIMLDTYSADRAGGTGKVFDWQIAEGVRRYVPEGAAVILAGGLRPDNVAEAIRQVRPDVVDVSSGVEASPGRKDPALIRAFVKAAKSS